MELHVEAQMPAILDTLRIPLYMCRGLGMSLSHNKHIAKRIFRCSGLPTANFFVLHEPSELKDQKLNYPLFVQTSL